MHEPSEVDGVSSEFQSALHAVHSRDFIGAEKAFRQIQQARPNDGPAKFTLKHLEEIRGHELPPNWNGKVELKEK